VRQHEPVDAPDIEMSVSSGHMALHVGSSALMRWVVLHAADPIIPG
jgi:hypothetical protein